MSRMMMIRCAFESWDLSASNDVPTSIFGPILTYLGWPEGQKSAKIVEISVSLTPLEKAKFSLFRKKRALACEICTWEYQVVVKICCSDSKQGHWKDKNPALGFRRWVRRFKTEDFIPNFLRICLPPKFQLSQLSLKPSTASFEV